MGTTLGEFHTLVSDALKRGTSVDSLIAKRVEMAARWLERNYTFQYMHQWRTLEIDSAATYPHIISLYDLEVKSVKLLRRRITGDDGTYRFNRPLLQVRPEDRETRPTGEPESYWLNGVSSIVLNRVPDEDMTFEAHLVQFTKWQSSTSWTHWLLDNATHLLLCRTLMMMGATRLSDPKMWQAWKAEMDLELQSFNVAEEELKARDFTTVWEPPEYAEADNSLRSE